MESMVQVAKGETAPFWTEERHVHFLNTMEASFVRTMLHRNGGDYYSGRWQLLRLDRHLPDSSESTLDSEESRNSKMKKKHEASPSGRVLEGSPIQNGEKKIHEKEKEIIATTHFINGGTGGPRNRKWRSRRYCFCW
ncbi:uncharacterized protein LOC107466905 isoform X2 [Arachis duranensis]|uniref:Uncharacterized protein LOC107466905 isoform X2 n=1 Tax=Arachis duranensis TaxID=130453 RepID=A0A9C6WN41_ARADU|nr:uncharacterized protein LOC107466905 isoform X2 [Arachis duranensis]